MNYQPICDNPEDGCMTNGAGYRLCCNPVHTNEPNYATLGPVWHKIAEWPRHPLDTNLPSNPILKAMDKLKK